MRRGGTGLAHTASPTTTLLRWLAQPLSVKAATDARRSFEKLLPRRAMLHSIFIKSPIFKIPALEMRHNGIVPQSLAGCLLAAFPHKSTKMPQ
jgi:hypothetical protein